MRPRILFTSILAAALAPACAADRAHTAPASGPTDAPAAEPTDGTASAPAEAGVGGKAFDRAAAAAALSAAADAARACKEAGGPTGSGEVKVTFAPSGEVTSTTVEGPPFAGTPVGGCVVSHFTGARVPPFDGSPVSITKSFDID
jgi:hypothetical protein